MRENHALYETFCHSKHDLCHYGALGGSIEFLNGIEPKDEGRFGSHRFMSCIPRAGMATSAILSFFFLTPRGLGMLREGSLGGAGRNRTLGLGALGKMKVPLPSFEKPQWFDALQQEAGALRGVHGETECALQAILPAILDKAFKGEL